jgi:hypothetical protein
MYARVASAVLENRNDDDQSGLKEVPGWRAPLDPTVTSRAVSCEMQLATFGRIALRVDIVTGGRCFSDVATARNAF